MSMMGQGNKTFFQRLRGNRNAFNMLLFEPMWGIPYNLFIPYFSLYMTQMGCTPEQIGLISTIGMTFQFLFSVVASPITDRLGRRRTTLIFDAMSWSVATLIWIFAQNFYFFLAAAIIQSINRVVFVSWTCLLVEDTEKDLLVPIFAWLTVAGLLSGFFSPIAAIFVQRYQLVPTMRWLLVVAFIMMTAMFILRNIASKETSVGVVRMEQSRKEPFLLQFRGLYLTIGEVWRNHKTRFLFILTAIYNMALTVRAPYFALLLTKSFGFEDSAVGYFALGTSVIMLFIYLVVQPAISRFLPKMPLAIGISLLVAGSLVLLPNFPSQSMGLIMVILSVVLTSVGSAVAQPFIDGLGHASMNNDNRSNMTSILFMLTLAASAPFGYIGGLLYDMNSKLPFLAASILYLFSLLLLVVFFKNSRTETSDESINANA